MSEFREEGIDAATVAASATVTGGTIDVSRWPYIAARVLCDTAADATLYFEFSADGETWPVSIPRALADVSSPAPIPFATVSRYARVKVINGTTELSGLMVQVFGTLQPVQLTASMSQTLEATWPVQAVRVVNDSNADIAQRLRDGINPTVWVAKGTASGNNVPIIMGPDGWVGTTALVTAGAPLRIKAGGNAADDAAGSGARQIGLEMIDETTGLRVVESLSTAGASASSATSTTAFRLLRAACRTAGTYGGVAGSNTGAITIETTGGVVVGVIPAGIGESNMGAWHIPAGASAIIRGIQVLPEGNKAIDLRLMRHDRADITTAPYRSVREVLRLPDVNSDIDVDDFDLGTFGERTDLYWVASVSSGSAKVTIITDLLIYE